MDKNLVKQKLEMWRKQEADLNKQLADVMKKKGAAAQEGDLRENAAYQMAIEESEVISARLATIQKVISDLEKSDSAKATPDKGVI